MDLPAAKALKASEGVQPSPLEVSLFQIVTNLELYRPYLPDSLFNTKVWLCPLPPDY